MLEQIIGFILSFRSAKYEGLSWLLLLYQSLIYQMSGMLDKKAVMPYNSFQYHAKRGKVQIMDAGDSCPDPDRNNNITLSIGTIEWE